MSMQSQMQLDMGGLKVSLPGGLSVNESVERLVVFKPLDGFLEQALSSLNGLAQQPAFVTAVLSTALAKIGELEPTEESILKLSIADRQFLMLQLALLLEGDHVWLQVTCAQCDEKFDVELKRSQLPVKESGKNYPDVNLKLNDMDVKAHVINGYDQIALVESNEGSLVDVILRQCITQVDGHRPTQSFFDQLTPLDVEKIEQALDEIAPAVCDELQVDCPECGCSQIALLDHFALNPLDPIDFYSEIHLLASHYHWSEQEILDLTRSKRRLYLKLISRSHGMME